MKAYLNPKTGQVEFDGTLEEMRQLFLDQQALAADPVERVAAQDLAGARGNIIPSEGLAELLSNTKNGNDGRVRRMQTILQDFSGQVVHLQALYDRYGVSDYTIRVDMREMARRGIIDKVGRGRYRIPKEGKKRSGEGKKKAKSKGKGNQFYFDQQTQEFKDKALLAALVLIELGISVNAKQNVPLLKKIAAKAGIKYWYLPVAAKQARINKWIHFNEYGRQAIIYGTLPDAGRAKLKALDNVYKLRASIEEIVQG